MTGCSDEHTLAAAKLSDDRLRRLRARLTEAGGIDGWMHAIGQVSLSQFLRGETGRWRGANFDFFLQAKTFARVMEGNYADRKTAPTGNAFEVLAEQLRQDGHL